MKAREDNPMGPKGSRDSSQVRQDINNIGGRTMDRAVSTNVEKWMEKNWIDSCFD